VGIFGLKFFQISDLTLVASEFKILFLWRIFERIAVISAKNHKRQRRKRQSVTAKREKSQTPKFLTATLTLPNLT